MIFMRPARLLFLVLSFFFSFSIFGYPPQQLQQRSQKIFINKISSQIKQERRHSWPGKRSWSIATLEPNLKMFTSKELKKKGFTEHYQKTEEGHIFHYYYTPSKREDQEVVAVINGLSAPSESAGNRVYGLPLHKHHQYGLIFMENVTCSSWGKRNKRIMLTAYEAGFDLYLRLKKIKMEHPEIKKIHLVGLSLGGNDSLFAAAIDRFLVDYGSPQIINGAIINFSSPLDRIKAFQEMPHKGLKAQMILNFLFSSFYNGNKKTFKRYTDKNFQQIFMTKRQEEIQEKVFTPILNSSIKKYPLSFSLAKRNFPLFERTSPSKRIILLNNFDPFKYLVQVPILWINSLNDQVVSSDTTSSYFSKKENNSRLMDIMLLPFGGHLGFSYSYGKNWVHQIIDAYFAYWR